MDVVAPVATAAFDDSLAAAAATPAAETKLEVPSAGPTELDVTAMIAASAPSARPCCSAAAANADAKCAVGRTKAGQFCLLNRGIQRRKTRLEVDPSTT